MRCEFNFNDGGRVQAGFKGHTSDFVTRSIAIATGLPYRFVYDAINMIAKGERATKRRRGRKSSARTGVFMPTAKRFVTNFGWEWVPTMFIEQGISLQAQHLRAVSFYNGSSMVSRRCALGHCSVPFDHGHHQLDRMDRRNLESGGGLHPCFGRLSQLLRGTHGVAT